MSVEDRDRDRRDWQLGNRHGRVDRHGASTGGIEPDAVWPRATPPRTLPQRTSRARARVRLSSNPVERQAQIAALDQLERAAGSSRTDVLGGYFAKEIDVVMADWDRGLELAVSTKSMTGSFGKNITNRFEEASGDLTVGLQVGGSRSPGQPG
jgi:hypothetical protein